MPVIVWGAEEQPADPGAARRGFVLVASRLPGGQISEAIPVSDPNEHVGSDGIGYGPVVGADGTGRAVIAWLSAAYPPPSNGFVFAATIRVRERLPDGTLLPAQTVYQGSGRRPLSGLRLAVGPAGDAVLIWKEHIGGRGHIFASYRPAGGAFGPPERLGRANFGTDLANHFVAINGDGTAAVVWSDPLRGGNPAPTAVRSAVRGRTGSWRRQTLGENSSTQPEIDVAVSERGAVLALWVANFHFPEVRSSLRLPGRRFCRSERISARGNQAFRPAVAFAPSGDALAVWSIDREVQTARWRGRGRLACPRGARTRPPEESGGRRGGGRRPGGRGGR